MNKITEIIEKNLVPQDSYIYGIADLQGIINGKFKDYNSGISIGQHLEDSIIDRIENGPTSEYLECYQLVNKELSEMVGKIKIGLDSLGLNSVAIKPTISTGSKDYEHFLATLRYDISHKMVATRAGLGWIGKTDLFISKKFGPRLRLASILIKENISITNKPTEKSKCGKCNICVEKCPAGAATGQLWDINTDRDIFFNAFKCRENCAKITRQLLNVDERICGICVSVCPIGKKGNKGK